MERLRETGFNERRCIARDVQGLYGTIVTIGTYSLGSGAGQLSPSDICDALQTCVRQHAALSVVVQGSRTSTPWLARQAELDIAKNHLRIVEPLSEDDAGRCLESLLARIHGEPFTGYESQPQRNLYVQPAPGRYYAAFAISHAIADGSSGFAFHASFLAALQGHAGSQRKADADLLPALDRAAHLPLSWSFFARTLAAEFLPDNLKHLFGLAQLPATHAWYGASQRPKPATSGTLLKTAICVELIPHEVLQGILAICRQHKCRLTGLLNHLTARSIAAALRARGKEFEKLISETAIDLRRCMPSARGHFANYASAVNEIHVVTTDSDQPLNAQEWLAVKQISERLVQAASSLQDHTVTLLKYVSNIPNWVTKRSTTNPECSFAVSNLGVFHDGSAQDDTTDWRIEDMVFSQSADATGAPFNINFASSRNGPLAITVTWWPSMLGVDDEYDFIRDICRSIAAQATQMIDNL